MIKVRLLLALFLTSGVLLTQAQQDYFNEFGQNRIQYKKFDWLYYSTTNFDIYYYSGGGDYAKQAVDFLDEEFNRLTDILGYAPYAKTKIFLYNSIHDLQQSNKGIDGANFTIGGQTDFIKLQMEVAHPGSAEKFREELVYRLSRILIEDMMFGGSLAEILQSSYLLSLPRWFIDGAAKYLAYGWSSEMDDYIRDYIGRKKIKKLIKIDGEEAGVIGQSIWNYIALTHGRSNISNILNLTRIIRNEENSIASTIGVPYRSFINNWQNYYLVSEEEILKDYKDPDDEDEIVSRKNSDFEHNNVRINPAGQKVAYSINDLGKYDVYVKDLETEKTVKVLKGGIIVPGQKVDGDLPLLDWIDDDQLGVVYYKRGFLYLATIDVAKAEVIRNKPLTRFKQIKSFSFNDNGRLAVISGDVDGRNDLFLVSMRRSAVRRITSDIYDDESPSFIPGTAAIVFSSNRPADSLNIADVPLEDMDSRYNLFIYDLDTTKNEFYRLTNTIGNDVKPHAKNESEIFYLSDQRGISNLYKYSFYDSIHSQVTNFSKNILDYDLHFDEDGITFLMLDEGIEKVYYTNKVDFHGNQFTGQTPRQRFEQAKFVANRYVENQLLNPDGVADVVADTASVDEDSALLDTDDYLFEEEEQPEDDSFVDTENYVFEGEDETQKENYRPESFFSTYRKFQQNSEVLGPIPYFPRFSFSNLVTSFTIDPLRGFGILLETQISDMLENHKVHAGALAITDLRSGDFFIEYEYLKRWVDFSVRFDKRLLVLKDDNETQLVQRYSFSKLEFGAALPISNWFRFDINPFFATTNFTNLQFQAVNTVNNVMGLAEDNRVTYAGIKGSAVFDNTIEKGFNIPQGTRAKFDIIQYSSISDQNRSFGNLRADIRHYQRVHREITFATRVFYGQFFGKNKPTYLVGGVPNWLLNNTNTDGTDNPFNRINNQVDNTNFLFMEYVTNIRGFDYAELYGSSSLVFNAELRIPVFQYLSRGPITSNFLRNFQLVGFYDIGSAWTGPIPLTRENSATEVLYRTDGSPFSGSIANFRNPWLAGVGAGLRTVLMGYYAKFDIARPIRDFELGNYRFYVSVGLDF
ncbi:MAG: translocation protein TolB [Cytophagales bacterium]|nr:translocation protein TolB [Cytophagales bacterium]